MTQIMFHTGGPAFHPVAEQATMLMGWLGERYQYAMYDGVDAFEHLEACDLLVLMGLHWTGMSADWCGNLAYRPMDEEHRHAFESYIASGRPVLAHHGAIASYDDWPRFGELLGFTWVWGTTTHSPIDTYQVQALPTQHPIITGVYDYTIYEELYYNVRVTPGLAATVHAATSWEEHPAPMILSAQGGRTPGAGRTVYLANGHDLRAFEAPMLKTIWVNAITWLLAEAAAI